jgi:hypothetical protein
VNLLAIHKDFSEKKRGRSSFFWLVSGQWRAAPLPEACGVPPLALPVVYSNSPLW